MIKQVNVKAIKWDAPVTALNMGNAGGNECSGWLSCISFEMILLDHSCITERHLYPL